MDQITEPTSSKHWRKIGYLGLGFNPIGSTPLYYNNITHLQFKKTQNMKS